MFEIILLLLVAVRNTTPCVAPYGQCGGLEYAGSTQCCPPTCQYKNDYYSQCSTETTSPTTAASTTPSAAQSSTGCNLVNSQCGGQNWLGSTCCAALMCTFINPYYSQCLPTSTTGASSSTTKPSTTGASSSTTKPSIIGASSSTTKPSTVAASSSTTKPSTAAASSSTTKPSTAAASSSTTKPSTTGASSSTTKPSTSITNPAAGCSNAYGQCGGSTWTGPKVCCTGSACQYSNDYYSQCIPIPGASTTVGSTTAPSTSSAGNDGRANGVTTRYWDCCKASCGWSGKASVTSPVKTCAKDGITPVGVNDQSGCNGGPAYMCNNQQPWNVSSTLSYGYAAAYISGQGESNWCCACYSLIFTSGPVVGKELIVQVTNTGGDLGNNHFDLQMPGGGFGIFDGCTNQFGGSYSWGQRYGGISQRSDCLNLPVVLRSGCLWRFDWFMNADNPTMRFKQVTCPAALTANTNCIRT